jgi:hypothetical protein
MLLWAGISAALLILTTVVAAAAIAAAPLQATSGLQRRNETTLAGLLPGRTSLTKAQAILGKSTIADAQNHSAAWRSCSGDLLYVDSDDKGIVQQVRAEKARAPKRENGCSFTGSSESKWSTRLGLRLGSPAPQVLQLYGEPDSRSPSTKDGERLELLYYAFDWAGPDVPQVMEVLCTIASDGKPGLVVEITLAASSL